MQYDQRRFGNLDAPAARRGDWLLETILLPWLTLAETFFGLTHCSLILLDAPKASQPVHDILEKIEQQGPGLASRWVCNDLVIVVLNPIEWNSELCQWTLQLAGGKLGEASVSLLKKKAQQKR